MCNVLKEEAQGMEILNRYYRNCRSDISYEFLEHFRPFQNCLAPF
ncbi:MAG: hypothetical protein ABIF19_20800 [Planctomycetota bacterium]